MQWDVERTENFNKWWKKQKIDNSNFPWHKKALENFEMVILPKNQSCLFANTSYQCWVTRLPDKVRKIVKSHGFRVVFILDLEEKKILLQGIFRRDNLDYKGSNGKYSNAYKLLVKDLAKQFVEVD